MVTNPISQPIPTFELVSHEATESSFCAIVGYLGSCSQVSMDFFFFSISGYSNIYNIPKFQIATTSNKLYIAMDGVIEATGDLPSSVKLASELITEIMVVYGTTYLSHHAKLCNDR
ncbi:hypothetical protein ACR3K2_03380 [Cryptosporidium serpentis]